MQYLGTCDEIKNTFRCMDASEKKEKGFSTPTLSPSNPSSDTVVDSFQGVLMRFDFEPLPMLLAALVARSEILHSFICQFEVDQSFHAMHMRDLSSGYRTGRCSLPACG